MGMISDLAIDESIATNSIVWLSVPEDSPVMIDLFCACDGDAESGDVHEYWGTLEREDGSSDEWRVHVRVA